MLAPDGVDQAVARHDPIRVQQEHGKDGPLFRPAERARLSMRRDFERAKNPKLQGVVVRDSTLTPLANNPRLQGFSALSQRN